MRKTCTFDTRPRIYSNKYVVKFLHYGKSVYRIQALNTERNKNKFWDRKLRFIRRSFGSTKRDYARITLGQERKVSPIFVKLGSACLKNHHILTQYIVCGVRKQHNMYAKKNMSNNSPSQTARHVASCLAIFVAGWLTATQIILMTTELPEW